MWALRVSVAIAAVAWGALFLSSYGILVGSSQARKSGDGQDTLTCRYFIATSVISVDYWYSPNGLFGRAACPRLFQI